MTTTRKQFDLFDGIKPDASKLQEIIKSTEQDGQISFRGLIQALTVALG
ncbi:MAG: hypothetical protein HZA50_13810 [Planctomycetes bacterium]|nr:hypothetical protein [Planctomycetota bacterium]